MWASTACQVWLLWKPLKSETLLLVSMVLASCSYIIIPVHVQAYNFLIIDMNTKSVIRIHEYWVLRPGPFFLAKREGQYPIKDLLKTWFTVLEHETTSTKCTCFSTACFFNTQINQFHTYHWRQTCSWGYYILFQCVGIHYKTVSTCTAE